MTRHSKVTDKVVPFRRRRFVARHRRRGSLSLLVRPFLVALGIVGLPLGMGQWVYSSPRFQVHNIELEGLDRVSGDWAEATLAGLKEKRLFDVSMTDVETLLAEHPWVASVEISKELPDRLRVRVRERQAVALLRNSDRRLEYLDTEGDPIMPFVAGQGPSDLPILSRAPAAQGLSTKPALALLSEIDRLRPDWSRGLSEVEMLNSEDFRLYTNAVPFPILVNSRRLETGIRQLERYLTDILVRYDGVRAVDLRFARQIVIQPASKPHSKREGHDHV